MVPQLGVAAARDCDMGPAAAQLSGGAPPLHRRQGRLVAVPLRNALVGQRFRCVASRCCLLVIPSPSSCLLSSHICPPPFFPFLPVRSGKWRRPDGVDLVADRRPDLSGPRAGVAVCRLGLGRCLERMQAVDLLWGLAVWRNDRLCAHARLAPRCVSRSLLRAYARVLCG